MARICQDHWTELRRLIDDRGLTHLVSDGGEEAVRRMEEGGFDPLLNAHNAVFGNVLQVCGMAVLVGGGCPLCAAINGCACGLGDECHFLGWLVRAADEQLAEARYRGLVAVA